MLNSNPTRPWDEISRWRKGIKIPKMIDIAQTDIRRYTRLANKPKQKYGIFDKSSFSLIGACEATKNPYIFITRSNGHLQEINRNFDGTLNHYGPMAFATNQEKNE